MAVHTHQPVLEENMKPNGFGVLDDSPVLLSNVGGKRGSQVFLTQSRPSMPRPKKKMRLDQQRQAAIVSTGLHLSQNASNINHLLPSSSSFGEDFGGQFCNELDQLLHAQGEQLRRAIAERQQAQCKQLLLAADKSAAQILRNKQTEMDRLARRSTELANRVAQLQSESLAWQSKAMASQATASLLHAQVQHVMSATTDAAEDAGSACVDPDRAGEEGKMVCRACRSRVVSVVVLPCRHLCLCDGCDAAGAAKICPACDCVGSGSVRVFLC